MLIRLISLNDLMITSFKHIYSLFKIAFNLSFFIIYFPMFIISSIPLYLGEYAGVNEGATEVYRPQVTMATGLRNINGIREGHPMSRSADITTALQEKVAELTDSGDDATEDSNGSPMSGGH